MTSNAGAFLVSHQRGNSPRAAMATDTPGTNSAFVALAGLHSAALHLTKLEPSLTTCQSGSGKLGADRRRIAEVVGSLANGVEHLPPPGAFAGRRRGAGERVEHRDGSEQRAEIVERNFDACGGRAIAGARRPRPQAAAPSGQRTMCAACAARRRCSSQTSRSMARPFVCASAPKAASVSRRRCSTPSSLRC